MVSLLLALSNTAMTSLVCEKKALFALCLVIQEKNIDVALVSKVRDKTVSEPQFSLSCRIWEQNYKKQNKKKQPRLWLVFIQQICGLFGLCVLK
jgi:hypothetical protein